MVTLILNCQMNNKAKFGSRTFGFVGCINTHTRPDRKGLLTSMPLIVSVPLCVCGQEPIG